MKLKRWAGRVGSIELLGSGKTLILAWARCRATLDVREDSRLRATGSVQVRVELEVHPEGLGGAEVLGEAERRARSNAPAAVHDFVDALVRHVEGVGQLALADAHRPKELL